MGIIKVFMVFSLPFVFAVNSYSDFLPFKLQAALVVKALNCNVNADKCAVNGTVTVGIICDPGKTGIELSKSLLMEFVTLKSMDAKIKQNALDFCLIIFDAEKLKETVTHKDVKVFYVLCANPENVSKITEYSQANGILTITGNCSKEKLSKGITLDFELENAKPAIYLNPVSAKKEGADFTKEFLAVTKTSK